MNRDQRRFLGRMMRRQGRVVITLKGGPMDGWLVKENAPCLEPDWREKYLEAVAEQIYRDANKGWLKPKWDKADPDLKEAYRHEARALKGAGYYKVDSSGAQALWHAG